MKHLFLIVLVSGALLSSCNSKTSYQSLSELEAEQNAAGYVLLGRFGNHWPAEIIQEKTAANEIHFTHQGTPQSYPGYTGYQLKVLQLKDGSGQESSYVFRSQEKK